MEFIRHPGGKGGAHPRKQQSMGASEREQHEMGEGHEIETGIHSATVAMAGQLSLVFPQKGVDAGNGRCRSPTPPPEPVRYLLYRTAYSIVVRYSRRIRYTRSWPASLRLCHSKLRLEHTRPRYCIVTYGVPYLVPRVTLSWMDSVPYMTGARTAWKVTAFALSPNQNAVWMNKKKRMDGWMAGLTTVPVVGCTAEWMDACCFF